MKTRNRDEVKADFRRRGVTVAQWARQHGYGYQQVLDVLRGRTRGNYGEAHNIAVALGIKDGTPTTAEL